MTDDRELDDELSPEQQAEVLADLNQWSGGCIPSEISPDELEIYISHSADSRLPEAALRKFLLPE